MHGPQIQLKVSGEVDVKNSNYDEKLDFLFNRIQNRQFMQANTSLEM